MPQITMAPKSYGCYANIGAVSISQICQFYAKGCTAPLYGSSYMCQGAKEHPVWRNKPLPTIRAHAA